MTTRTRVAVPRSASTARVLLVLVALNHIVVPVAMLVYLTTLAAQVAAQHPEFDAATVAAATDIALRSAVVFHAVLLAITVFSVVKLRNGRPWVRRFTTVSQLIAVVFSLVSWQSSPMFHAVIPVVGLIQIVAVSLLWTPSSTAFFGRAGAFPDQGGNDGGMSAEAGLG